MIQGIRCNPKTLEVERDGVVIKLTTRAMLLFEGLLWLGPLDGLNKREAAVRLLGRDWSKYRHEPKFSVLPMGEIRKSVGPIGLELIEDPFSCRWILRERAA